jgi:hypothetical protein
MAFLVDSAHLDEWYMDMPVAWSVDIYYLEHGFLSFQNTTESFKCINPLLDEELQRFFLEILYLYKCWSAAISIIYAARLDCVHSKDFCSAKERYSWYQANSIGASRSI